MSSTPAPLLHNRWFGKALGCVAALIWAPPEPAWIGGCLAAGGVAGHLFDRWSGRMLYPLALGGLTRRVAPRAAATEPYLQYLFAGLGRVSKASGRVTEKHIAYVDGLINRLGLTDTRRAAAIAWFNDGKRPDFPLRDVELPAHAFRMTLLDLITECLATAACIAPAPDVKDLVYDLVTTAGGEPPDLDQVFTEGAKSAARVARRTAELDEACRLLGIERDTDTATLKTAYRRKVSQCHPDKLPPDASPGVRARADTETRKLRAAYELMMAFQD